MKITFSIKKGAILATLLFIFTFAIPLTSSINNVTNEDALNSYNDMDDQKNVTISCHMFGIPSKLSKEITVTRFQAEELFNEITDLQTEIANNPKSEKIQQLQEEIADFTLKYDLLPKDLSQKLVSSESNLKESKIFNLLSPSKSSQRSASQFLCNFVSTGSGTSLPIIVLPRLVPILLTPIPRALMIWNTNQGVTSCGGLYSDTGFIAYGEQNGISIGFWGIGFTINLPPIQGYGVLGYALYANVNAEQIQYFPPNNPPVISIPNPSNLEQNVPLSLSKLSFHIDDEDNDLMSYTVTTEPNIGSGSGNIKRDGEYSISVSNLEFSTEYKWTVKVDDGKDSTTSTFSFVTIKEEPVISDPHPSDYGSAQKTLKELRFDINDTQGDLMDYTVETSPDIGSKSGYGVSDGTVIVPVSGLKDDTWYHWYVNVTDGAHWTREVFSFFTGGLGLAGYWSFDEGSGSIAHDSSGNDNHGTIHGASWTTGISGYALEFDGDGDYIDLPDDIWGENLVLEVRIKAYSFGSTNPSISGKAIIFKAPDTGNVRDYSLGLSRGGDGDNRVYFDFREDANNIMSMKSNKILEENEWYHIKATRSNGVANLYIDGVLDNTESYDFTPTNHNHDLKIGITRASFQSFNGIIDDIKISTMISS